jgi:hypothetical protein
VKVTRIVEEGQYTENCSSAECCHEARMPLHWPVNGHKCFVGVALLIRKSLRITRGYRSSIRSGPWR